MCVENFELGCVSFVSIVITNLFSFRILLFFRGGYEGGVENCRAGETFV